VRAKYPFSALHIVWSQLDKDAKTILDVGCGQGEPMSFINKRRNFKVTGVDLFQPYLEKARRKAIYQDLINCNALSLPFEDKTFDAVICMELLEHLEQTDGILLLDELERVARKQILLTTPTGKYEQDAYDGNSYQEHKFLWTPESLRSYGYKIRGTGIKGLPRSEIKSSIIRYLRDGTYALGGIVSFSLPQLGCHVVGDKKLNHNSKGT